MRRTARIVTAALFAAALVTGTAAAASASDGPQGSHGQCVVSSGSTCASH